MDDSKFFALMVLLGLVVWEGYYVVSNFGWMPLIYLTLFATGQGICRRMLEP